MPVVGPWYPRRRIAGLMTRRARKADSPLVFRTAPHRHDMTMTVVTLARKIRRGMAIQAPPILKDRRQAQKQLLRFG